MSAYVEVGWRVIIVDSPEWKALQAWAEERGLKRAVEVQPTVWEGDYVTQHVKGFFGEPERAYLTLKGDWNPMVLEMIPGAKHIQVEEHGNGRWLSKESIERFLKLLEDEKYK